MTGRGQELAGVVLAAGSGRRLWPLTAERPKALCPVGGVALVDLALARVQQVVTGSSAIAVNLHHHGDQLDAHLPGEVHRSREEPEALGTAGALGAMRPWIDGRNVLVTNADAWIDPSLDLGRFVDDWDGQRTRLLCVDDADRADFGRLRYCGVALIPAATAAGLGSEPSGLYEVSWRQERASGRLDLVTTDAAFVDCGTPADYLAANMAASGGVAVVDANAQVGAGARLERSVVWAHSEVAPGETLVGAIRTPRVTVLVR